jgi:hypothetical protein
MTGVTLSPVAARVFHAGTSPTEQLSPEVEMAASPAAPRAYPPPPPTTTPRQGCRGKADPAADLVPVDFDLDIYGRFLAGTG